MTGTDTEAQRSRQRLLKVEHRIHSLESLAVRTFGLAAAGLLGLGSVLPVYTVPE